VRINQPHRMTTNEITAALHEMLTAAITDAKKKEILAEFEMMGNYGEYPVSHYVKMFLPASMKNRFEQATGILLN
jgi:hypothetical protein